MALASLKDLYFDELGDLYDAETQMIRTLPRLAEAARAPELREALNKHSDESRLHLEIQQVKSEWEADPDNWRNSYRLARAYDYAGDRGRARETMKRAVELERVEREGEPGR